MRARGLNVGLPNFLVTQNGGADMFDCMVNYLVKQWGAWLLWLIIALVAGYLAGGWWGILCGFGVWVLSALGFAAWNCSKQGPTH